MSLAAKHPADGGVLVVNNVSVTNATAKTVDVDVSGSASFTVCWRLKATATAGDLATPAVKPYYPDGVTLFPLALPTQTVVAPVASGADVVALQTFETRGASLVQVSMTNNNAAPKSLDVIVYQTS